VEIPFASSPRASLGVEWELELVDRETRQLASAASGLLAEIGAPFEGEHPKAKHELLESTVEIITGICGTVAEAKADLGTTLAEVSAAAQTRGLGVMCSGTHPTTDWATQEISPNPRYALLVETMQWLARRLQIFGVHVHVGVRSPEKAIPIVNALTAYVPHFLALSASSPYWIGTDTGLAVREVWWDIRPHPGFGTVELRICDGLPTLHEIGAVAALSQCLVDQLDTQFDRGYGLPRPKEWVVRENKWRAARYGLDAQLILDERGSTRPLRDALNELVDDLRPRAARLGCSEELDAVSEILEGGASYQRQRAVAEANGGDLTAVVDSLLAEMAAGRPLPMVPAVG